MPGRGADGRHTDDVQLEPVLKAGLELLPDFPLHVRGERGSGHHAKAKSAGGILHHLILIHAGLVDDGRSKGHMVDALAAGQCHQGFHPSGDPHEPGLGPAAGARGLLPLRGISQCVADQGERPPPQHRAHHPALPRRTILVVEQFHNHRVRPHMQAFLPLAFPRDRSGLHGAVGIHHAPGHPLFGPLPHMRPQHASGAEDPRNVQAFAGPLQLGHDFIQGPGKANQGIRLHAPEPFDLGGGGVHGIQIGPAKPSDPLKQALVPGVSGSQHHTGLQAPRIMAALHITPGPQVGIDPILARDHRKRNMHAGGSRRMPDRACGDSGRMRQQVGSTGPGGLLLENREPGKILR